ncbi:MAG: TolC family protein [Acidobacteria bacterium]|nr:TolC family protein [Acidobacteriota bacterium]
MRSRQTLNSLVAVVVLLATGPGPAETQTLPVGAGPPPAVSSTVTLSGLVLPASAWQPSDGPTRRLSIDEAVTLALEQNLDLQVERINPRIQDMGVAEAQSVYTPVISSTFIGNNQNSPSSGFLSGAGNQNSVTDRNLRNGVDVVQEVPWKGGRYTASWDGSHRTSSSVFFSFDPILQSNLSLNYTQPLLRNFAIDTPRWQIAITQANREMSDIQLRTTVVRIQRDVRNAYWGLVSAQSFLSVQRQSLELAQESLRNNRTRVEVGTMAPIDIVEAESEVARNEENVIIAEAGVDRAEDLLRTLVFDPEAPEFWSIRIQPSDTPMLAPREIDIDAAIRNALSQRTDLDALDRNIKTSETDIQYFRNQQLPDVNLQVDYRATGLGGTFLERGGAFGIGEITGRQETSFASVLGNIFTNDFPTWTVGVSVSYPLGTSGADANLERARLQRSQDASRRRSLEMRVAAEVRDAARAVNTNLQRVEATRASRILGERRLAAEQRRFEVGLSSTFLVFQAQRDLAQARNREEVATLDYTRSLVDFDAVQEVPLF